MIAEPRPLAEITQEALRLLYRDMGIVNTVRFLNQFIAGFGDYTEERRATGETETLDGILADLHKHQAVRSTR